MKHLWLVQRRIKTKMSRNNLAHFFGKIIQNLLKINIPVEFQKTQSESLPPPLPPCPSVHSS